MAKFRSHQELEVYQMAFESAMHFFEMSKQFPVEEEYSLTDRIRRSARSVCANTAEAFRKRQYGADFVAKIHDAEAEAAETQVWLDFLLQCCYLNLAEQKALKQNYEFIIGKLVTMRLHSEQWKP
jgi:four helix bundle protein